MNKRNLFKKNNKVLLFIIFIVFLYGMGAFSKFYVAKPLNIILISIDTLRADHMGIYGYKRETTPNMDAFAKESILFMNAYSQASWTPPSLASILSGIYPNEHGVGDWNNIANPKVKFLMDRLPKNSYNSAFITNHPSLFLENLGFTKGYDRKIIYKNNYERADKVTKSAIKFLQQVVGAKKPFILWVHYFDPHEPFEPSEPFCSNFIQKYKNEIPYETTSICEIESYYGLNCISPYIIRESNTNVNYYSLLYDAEIAEVDFSIGQLIEQIKKLKLMNNTIIVITSDHGEIIKRCNVLNDKCVYLSHGTFLFNELIHVPLILHIPNQNKSIIVNDNVATIDILPTLSYLNKDISKEGYNGVSLLPINEINKLRKIYSYEIRLKWIASLYKRWEFIKYDNFSEFYKINNSDDELINFPNFYEPIPSKICKILENSMDERDSVKFSKQGELDEELVDKLNSLGYISNIKQYFDKK